MKLNNFQSLRKLVMEVFFAQSKTASRYWTFFLQLQVRRFPNATTLRKVTLPPGYPWPHLQTLSLSNVSYLVFYCILFYMEIGSFFSFVSYLSKLGILIFPDIFFPVCSAVCYTWRRFCQLMNHIWHVTSFWYLTAAQYYNKKSSTSFPSTSTHLESITSMYIQRFQDFLSLLIYKLHFCIQESDDTITSRV